MYSECFVAQPKVECVVRDGENESSIWELLKFPNARIATVYQQGVQCTTSVSFSPKAFLRGLLFTCHQGIFVIFRCGLRRVYLRSFCLSSVSMHRLEGVII